MDILDLLEWVFHQLLNMHSLKIVMKLNYEILSHKTFVVYLLYSLYLILLQADTTFMVIIKSINNTNGR